MLRGAQAVTALEVKSENALSSIMFKIINQHNISISARCLNDQDESSTRHELNAVTQHSFETVDDFAGSDIDPSIGTNKAKMDMVAGATLQTTVLGTFPT